MDLSAFLHCNNYLTNLYWNVVSSRIRFKAKSENRYSVCVEKEWMSRMKTAFFKGSWRICKKCYLVQIATFTEFSIGSARLELQYYSSIFVNHLIILHSNLAFKYEATKYGFAGIFFLLVLMQKISRNEQACWIYLLTPSPNCKF